MKTRMMYGKPIKIEVNSNFKKYMFNLLNTNIIEIYDSNKLRKEKIYGKRIIFYNSF